MTLLRIAGWVAFGLLTAGGAALLARRVLRTPPGRRRWLEIDAAVLALLTPVDVAAWALSGGGYFWPVYSIAALSLIFGLHVWYVVRTPDPVEGALTRRLDVVTRTRRAALDARSTELARVERDLHDGAQARLVSLALNLGLAETLVLSDPTAAVVLLGQARETAVGALEDLRSVMHGIRPGVLADRGLLAGVRALAIDLTVPVDVVGDPGPALSSAAERAVYFAVAECLANVVKHSGAEEAVVRFSRDDLGLTIEVTDSGRGGAVTGRGSGLTGIADRLAPFDGTVSLVSPAGGPTTVTMALADPARDQSKAASGAAPPVP